MKAWLLELASSGVRQCSDTNIILVLKIVAEAFGISNNLLVCIDFGEEEIRSDSLFALEKRRWVLKFVTWQVGLREKLPKPLQDIDSMTCSSAREINLVIHWHLMRYCAQAHR
ncbi:LOW QUALITY PROTEIN: hypothetical protein PHMEG_0001966 [Phytophthora megakarya]|uniref:Uncharacterized protein n=1 Tax=Phytophthora megakarya TaxID=4795 RepID=A0A225X0B8_9STRA|nr:LOW QUALITY PROTEIN: hypothetical protein PHMEG_0001966 [Phytophthora megakarya]